MRKVSLSTLILILSVLYCTAIAQTSTPQQGIREYKGSVFLLKNFTLVSSPGVVVADAMMLVRDGKIESTNPKITPPKDAKVIDLKGAWVYPGFIDPFSTLGLDDPKANEKAGRDTPQYETKTAGPFAWNQAVKPEFSVAEAITLSEENTKALRKLGYTTLNLTPNDGVFRGTSCILHLNDEKIHQQIYQADAALSLSFQKGSSTQNYPSSLMGSIALIRQTFLDADWYGKAAKNAKSAPNLETNLSLAALNQQLSSGKPMVFETENYQNSLRAVKLGQEFGHDFILKTNGDEYKAAAAFKEANTQLILPLNFPKAPDVSDIADARYISLGKMKDWEQLPAGPAMLNKAGIPFAFTLEGLKKKDDFFKQLEKALQHGLSEAEALNALTVAPAKMLGIEGQFGSLESGKFANFIVSEGNIFEKDNVILNVWVTGRPYQVQLTPTFDPRGKYDLNAGSQSLTVEISGKPGEYKAKFFSKGDTTGLKGKISVDGDLLNLSYTEQKDTLSPAWRFNGTLSNNAIAGMGEDPQGVRFSWSAKRTGPVEPEEKKEKSIAPDLANAYRITYPNQAYGFEKLPEQGEVLIKNATVWTNTEKGILQNADVLLREGKIAKVGTGLSAPSAIQIDGTGKHLTCGIIDEHSHIAITQGVNEGTHAVSAEVSIGDVIDATDVNIYRQLSGGVTTSQLLHGSANPIGGQSGIIKLRWGSTPEEMKISDAAPFIKFALGENVKQSNWGDAYTVRYPQTRAGVEQSIKDAFTAALDYQKSWKAFEAGKNTSGIPPRINLQYEALLEILNKKRFITCHSYVQSELTMLMRLAEEFGFRVNTFTHVLEGYKVADKLKTHGASASTFSDWWAYKYEVIDAIPYNAAMMAKHGINTCINSDDAEMARRLNQEAAKAIKYGGLSEEEAFKLVTLNPAKALHLDHRMGSVAPGMDADVVLWSGHPLSIYTKAEKTYVDGRLLFDLERDAAMREAIRKERMRLITRMLASDEKDSDSDKWKQEKKLYHCDGEE